MTRSENDSPDPLVMPAGGGAGRQAISPEVYSAEVASAHRFPGPKAWGMIAKRLYAEFFYRGLPDKGATLSFYSIFTAIPTLMAFYAIVMLVLDQNRDQVLGVTGEFINRNIPADFAAQASNIIEAIIGTTQRSLITLIIAVLFALFSSSAYVRAFSRSANALYGREEGRSILRTWLVMWGLTIALVAGLVLIAAGFFLREELLSPFFTHIADPLGLAGLRTFMLDYFLPLWTWLRWPVIFGISQMLIALLYHVAPNVKQGRFRLFTAGSVSALVVLTLLGVGFRTYLNNFLHVGMYGALGGIIGGFFCLFMANNVLLLGLQLDAELARARELAAGFDSTELILAPPRASGAADGEEQLAETLQAEAEHFQRRVRNAADD